MTACTALPWIGLVFAGSGWTTGGPEWVRGYVTACTHTPLPYAWCAPRVGGFRTREDERARCTWWSCFYGVLVYLGAALVPRWLPLSSGPGFAPLYPTCANDWWDVSPGWASCR